MKKLIIALIALLITFAASAFTGTLTRVIDGDTVEVTKTTGEVVKVRLSGIDCPEKNQPWGYDATEFLRLVYEGKKVDVIEKTRDRYGRVIGVIYYDNQIVNAVLIMCGLAWVYDKYPDRQFNTAWLELQRTAKKNGVSLWGDAAPVAPWEWRQRK